MVELLNCKRSRIYERDYKLFNTTYLRKNMVVRNKRTNVKYLIKGKLESAIILKKIDLSEVIIRNFDLFIKEYSLVKFIDRRDSFQESMILSEDDLLPIYREKYKVMDFKYIMNRDTGKLFLVREKSPFDGNFIVQTEEGSFERLTFTDIYTNYNLVDVKFKHPRDIN